MARLPPLTALALFLVVSTGGSLAFTVEPKYSNLNVRVGRDAIFTVQPSAAISSGTWVFKGRTIINWIGTSSMIDANYRSRVKVSYTTGTLALETVTERDSGDYMVTVQAQGTGLQDTATVKLLALEPVSNVQLDSNLSLAVENQHSVQLTCSSRGTHLRWEWLLNDQPVQQNDRINISRDTLLINPVNRTDAGTYKCIVSNGLNSGRAVTTLHVYYGPDNMEITPRSPVNTKVGKDLTLTCFAQSEPSPTYVWSKGAVQLLQGPEFTISSVSKEDSSNYTCHVRNAALRTNNILTAQVIVHASSALPETKFCLSPGAIAGIVVGLFAACLISGGCGWLIARKTSGPKATPGKKYNANGSPKGEDTLAANAGNGSAAYENIQDIQQGRRTNAPIGDPTYMELKIEDRSVYDELKR